MRQVFGTQVGGPDNDTVLRVHDATLAFGDTSIISELQESGEDFLRGLLTPLNGGIETGRRCRLLVSWTSVSRTTQPVEAPITWLSIGRRGRQGS